MTEDSPTLRLTLRPIGLEGAAASDERATLLAGAWQRFHMAEAVLRDGAGQRRRQIGSLETLGDWAETQGAGALFAERRLHLSQPRPPFAGLSLDRPQVMGIVNVTPDSFSDGGDRFEADRAIEDGLAMQAAGAAILDIGGESTRPGADPVSPQAEIDRVLPVVEALVREGALVSIDSRRAVVQRAALDAGAAIVNDVTALTGDPDSLSLAVERQVPVVMMHMLGTPKTMQQDPRYDDAALDIHDYLEDRVRACEAAGLGREKLVVDPGIGFGKTVDHNLRILEQLAVYHGLGCGVLLGASRKSFIGKLSRGEAPKERLPGSLTTVHCGLERGVQFFRVHDVAETLQALRLWQAINEAR